MVRPLDSEFIKNDKIVKHTVNGISRFLMLWIIMQNGPIHGYRIIKHLDTFFENLIDEGVLKKSSPSKIYPILKEMENGGLIDGQIKIKDNKKITYYQITDAGRYMVHYIRDSYHIIRNTSQGSLFVEFFSKRDE